MRPQPSNPRRASRRGRGLTARGFTLMIMGGPGRVPGVSTCPTGCGPCSAGWLGVMLEAAWFGFQSAAATTGASRSTTRSARSPAGKLRLRRASRPCRARNRPARARRRARTGPWCRAPRPWRRARAPLALSASMGTPAMRKNGRHHRRGSLHPRLRRRAAQRRGLQPRRRQGQFLQHPRSVRARGADVGAAAALHVRRDQPGRRPHLLLQRPQKDASHYPGWDITVSLEQTIAQIVEAWQQKLVS